ncbi:hypothetical protein [Agreia sp. COWG]|uniref:hypothetical protein n=1 Tax=Agreia sp. COWG TaxID=2773266 RepID=UPI001928FE05|nr:hypothetical protein [Agreia sp. COWG]CAD5996215.1 conserved exported protein of unknown function [Agreia sp. COWG]
MRANQGGAARFAVLAAAALVVAALAGCSAPAPSPSPTATATAVPSDLQGGRQPTTTMPLMQFPDSAELGAWCPLDTPAVHLHQLDVEVTGAVVCTSALGTDGAATITVNTVEAGLDALLDAYAAPNAPIDDTIACTAQLKDPLLVWLSYPGERAYPVYAPVDACGFPTADAESAFTSLTLTPAASFGLDGAPAT